VAIRLGVPDTLVLAKSLPAAHPALPEAVRSDVPGTLAHLEAATQSAAVRQVQSGAPDILVEAAR